MSDEDDIPTDGPAKGGRQDNASRARRGTNVASSAHEPDGLSRAVTDAVGDSFNSARAGVDSLTNGASEFAGAAATAMNLVAEDKAASMRDTLAEAIEEKPIMSIAVAVGMGFLVGAVMRR